MLYFFFHMNLRSSGHVASGDKLKRCVFTSTRLIITTLYEVVTQYKRPPINSYEPLITWSREVTWQTKNVIFIFYRLRTTKLERRDFGWGPLILKVTRPKNSSTNQQNHMTFRSQRRAKSREKQKKIQLNF